MGTTGNAQATLVLYPGAATGPITCTQSAQSKKTSKSLQPKTLKTSKNGSSHFI